MERKGNCKSWSAYLWRKVHILYIQWNTNLSKRGDGSYSLFLIIKAKLTATTFQQQEKKMNIKFVMHRVKIYLNGLFSFYQGILRTMKMSFYKRKISWDLCHFAYSTESFSRFYKELHLCSGLSIMLQLLYLSMASKEIGIPPSYRQKLLRPPPPPPAVYIMNAV